VRAASNVFCISNVFTAAFCQRLGPVKEHDDDDDDNVRIIGYIRIFAGFPIERERQTTVA